MLWITMDTDSSSASGEHSGAKVEHRASMLRSVAWNYAGYACDLVSGILLLAYVVRRVSPTEYGLLLLAGSLSTLLYLMDLGLFNILVQAYVEAAETHNKQKLEALLSTTFIVLAGLGTIGLGIFLVTTSLLPGPFKIPPQYLGETKTVFCLMGLLVQIGLPTTALDQIYQAFHRFDRTNQIQFLGTVIRVLLTVLALAAGYGIVALAAIQVVLAAVRIGMLWLFLPSIGPGIRLKFGGFDWNLLRPLLRPGVWAWAENISRQLAVVSDSLILGMFGSMDAVALFGMGGKLPAHVSTVVSRGAIVVLPAFSRHGSGTSESRRIYINTLAVVFGGALPVVVLGCMCARPLMQIWAGDRYVGAAPIMQWLLLAAFSMAIEHPSDLLLYGTGHVKTAARIAIFESVANIIVSLLLVSRYGAVGLAAGTALTHSAINAFWYTPAACSVAKISPWKLIKAAFYRLGWPSLLLILEIIVIWFLYSFAFSARVIVCAGIASGMLYVALWAVRTVIPLSRTPMEAIN